MNVISITTKINNPSRSLAESNKRRKRVLAAKKPSWEDQKKREQWYAKINYNIDYWKKHGTLPNNTDMNKVRGKGDAYARHRG